MVKDPRSPKPGSQEPDIALDLLRALARTRPLGASPAEHDHAPAASDESDQRESFRTLAETLDRQLKAPRAAAGADMPLPGNPDRPPARGWSDTARREWSALAAALPRARELKPRLDRQRLAFLVAALAALALAALGRLIGERTPANTVPVAGPASPGQLVPPIVQAPAPTAPPDVAAITKAMSDCDAAAARDTDSLYFLSLPLVPANRTDHDWRAVALQTIGNAYLLLSAKDALDGLRDGKLILRQNRYTFSILDSGSGATYSWTSATGMVRLQRKDSGAVKTLKLGFDFSDNQSGAQWSAEFKREPGTCYWVSALVRE